MPIIRPSYDDSGSTDLSRHQDSRRPNKETSESDDMDICGGGMPIDSRASDLDLFKLSTSDREDLIQYIKKGDMSSWRVDYSVRVHVLQPPEERAL